MDIQRKQVGPKGMFYVEKDGEVHAKMVYHMITPENMVIDHTEVDDELKGQSVGYELVLAAVENARLHHLTITPLCTFASSVFKKKPDFQDVLAK
jgi:predicted GNAT family acetyltransferase